jgi:putative intracellular protease/amidase
MTQRKRVLLVLTSHDDLAGTGNRTGTWLEELAASYYPLVEAGFDVTLASVKGGEAPLDPASFDEPWITDTGRRFLADEAAMAKVKNTPALKDVAATAFDAVYMIGGAGTAWDFPNNKPLGDILTATASRGAVVAGVCHGVLGFVNGANGKAMGAGRKLTCISDQEDNMAGYDKLVPMLPESTFKKLGATVTLAAEPFGAHVVVDGNMITGQNPASAPGVAKAIVEKLA